MSIANISGTLHHKVLVHGRTGETTGIFNQRTDTDSHTGIGVLLAKELDLAAVRHKMTAKQLHRGGFAAAVLTDKAVDTAYGNGHIQMVNGIHAAKALGQVSDLNRIHKRSPLHVIPLAV